LKKKTFLFFSVALCLEKNILTRDYVDKYEFSSILCLSTMGNAYENGTGESCSLKNPEILIKFKQPNLASVSKVEVQRESLRYPGNVRQIQAAFISVNGSIIVDEVTGQPINWTSPEDNPIITGYFNDVRGLTLKVLKTDNNVAVQRLRVKVTGCYSLGSKILFEINFHYFIF
jgi:hypothetical protein